MAGPVQGCYGCRAVLPALLVPAVASALALAAPFVPAEQAAKLIDEGATVLDARGPDAFAAGHLPGARPIAWLDFNRGTLLLDADSAALARKLATLGVDAARPVLVYGAAQAGWGEEGRIAWMLAYLGHPTVRILDGGFPAWLASGRSAQKGPAPPPAPARFEARLVAAVRADLAAVRAPSAQLLDVRSRGEFDLGHFPGARNLDWHELLSAGGRALTTADARNRIARAGLDPDRPLILYCSGGVRSAEAWAVLAGAGLSVRSFDGSFEGPPK